MRRRGLLVVLVLLLAGCVGYPLRDARTTPPYADLLARAATLEHHEERIACPSGGPVLAVEHVTTAGPPAERLIVLVSGVFSSRGTWRFLVASLAEEGDLLLVDPPGCGASDVPDPRVHLEAYTPAWMARQELRVIDAWRRARGDTRPIVFVGHSLGAAALLRALAEPEVAAEAPDVVRAVTHAVLISPPDVIVERSTPTMEKLLTLQEGEVMAARALGLLDRMVSKGVWEAQFWPRRSAFFRDGAAMRRATGRSDLRRAGQAMLRRYNPARPDGSIDRDLAAGLRAHLGGVAVPVLLLAGEGDEAVTPDNARRLAAALPRADLRVVPEARHSPHAERAPYVARAIRSFLARPAGDGAAAKPLSRLPAAD